MKNDCVFIIIEECNDWVMGKTLPVREGRYDYVNGEKVITRKTRKKEYSWVIPNESNPIYAYGLPFYVVSENSVIALRMNKQLDMDALSFNKVLKRNIGHESVKRMGRPLNISVNLKAILIIAGIVVIGLFVYFNWFAGKGA